MVSLPFTTNTEIILISAALLLLTSVIASKISDRFGVPALLLFLVLGMLAGSDGLGGIYFDDASLAQFIAVVALALILFSGGLDTRLASIKPVLKQGIALSTLGVLLTAIIVGYFVQHLLGLSFIEGFLLGAIISSTDAAAVFSILRSKNIGLKGNLKPLLELESGSNDPMAVFLTVGLVHILLKPSEIYSNLILVFILQMTVGALVGLGMGWLLVNLVNRIKLGYLGLYPVLTLSIVLLTYGIASLLDGNGFLAVYLAGIWAGNRDFIHKRSLVRYHDGVAWLMQIVMFLTLGLLVFPTRLPPVASVGLILAVFLMIIARPISVFICLAFSSFNLRQKAFISWIGLRGAVPIVLATFPLLAGLAQAETYFNLVFFVVLTSVLLQGTTVSLAAKWLGVSEPIQTKLIYPLEYYPVGGLTSELKEIHVPKGSPVAGRAIVELGFPAELLILLIARGEIFLLPHGGIVLEEGDTLLTLTEKEAYTKVKTQISPRG